MEHQEGVPIPFIATSSRDRMIKVWQEENGAYTQSKTLVSVPCMICHASTDETPIRF